jgi:hypothetical protein
MADNRSKSVGTEHHKHVRSEKKAESTNSPNFVDVKEQKRLNDAREAGIPWKKWGPYLSERRYGGNAKFQEDPHWRDLILFYEYFHGENGAGLGASHQTGWTGTIARLLDTFGRINAVDALMTPVERIRSRLVREQVGGKA